MVLVVSHQSFVQPLLTLASARSTSRAEANGKPVVGVSQAPAQFLPAALIASADAHVRKSSNFAFEFFGDGLKFAI